MKSRNTFIILAAVFILAAIAALFMFSVKNTTTPNPVVTTTVATSTIASTTLSGMQVYRNEKLGIQFEYASDYTLTSEEWEGEVNKSGYLQNILIVYAMHPDYQRPVNILKIVQGAGWGKIKKDIQDLVDGPIKATKKVFEKPYKTVTSIKGVTRHNGDAFCDWYIKNPTKEYIVLVGCHEISIIDSITFF
jgi:hypothetical protein